MLLNVTLPVSLTVPENVSIWPGAGGVAGHVFVTAMPAVKASEQVTLLELVTVSGYVVYSSVAVTTSVTVLGAQAFNGIQLPLKEAIWPVSRLVTKTTWVARPLSS